MIFRLIECLRGWLMPYPFWLRDLGSRGEYLARRHFHRRGYHLVARNLRIGNGEIDLIMAHHKSLLFVEVKARRNTKETLQEVLGKSQEQRLIRLAEAYVSQFNDWHTPWDFVLVLVTFSSKKRVTIQSAPF